MTPAGPRGVAMGFLAMAPMLIAYEAGVAMGGTDGPRNFAELLACRMLAVFGSFESAARILLLVLLSVAAFARLRMTAQPIGRHILRTPLEGGAFALALGPVLLIALALFGLGASDLGLREHVPESGVALDRALRAFGAGAWEELLFRVGAYSAVFVAVRALTDLAGAKGEWRLGLADGLALVLSSLAFAACHLASFMSVVGLVGEAWEPRVFLWRVLAGLFLGGLYRWRGPGVAAWCHGVFNLALLLGAGPGVFR